jgi:hypothetical protein
MTRRETWLALAALLVAVVAAPAARAAVYHVSARAAAAADTNPGTGGRPFRTIAAALKRAGPGDTVLVGAGTYREAAEWPGEDWKDPDRRMTLAAEPGARPVVKGSDVLAAKWERAPGAKPIFFQPREAYTQMVFADEAPVRQIGLQGNPVRAKTRKDFVWQRQWDGKGLGDMAPGGFFYDADARRLYVWLADGSDPGKHVIEAAVRPVGVAVKGTWTVRGLDVRHCMDGLWPTEQAVALTGSRCVVEDCHIDHNEFLGLIVSGQDCVIRRNVIAYNGLEGCTSNLGYRMLVEGNEFHHNAWRGDVACLTAGNKWVMWRDCKFLRNYFHDEPAAALWMDISDGNILIAENRFDNCRLAIYFEISRWGVIANNVFRHCGQGVWVYSSDVLVAHNIVDSCGDGITISGYPRDCDYTQAIAEPIEYCMMAVRNNLVVGNMLVDCPGSYIGITPPDAFGAGNFSDYNAFVWTLPAYHPTGCHINFVSVWNQIYARLPEWRMARHCDEHSVVADPGLVKEIAEGNQYVALSKEEVVADAGFVGRDKGDYRLAPDSPLRGRGLSLPATLNSPCAPCRGDQVLTRQWAETLLADAPDAAAARAVYAFGDEKHYRLQPLPRFRRLVDLDACAKGDPGLKQEWSRTGAYPVFDAAAPAETATDDEWAVFPGSRIADPSFDKPITAGGPADGPGPWYSHAGLHTFVGMACANLLRGNQQEAVAIQKVGTVAVDGEYVLFGDATVSSVDAGFGGVARVYLAVGDGLQPLGEPAVLRAAPGKARGWQTVCMRARAGKAGQDAAVGQDLYVVIGARVEGPADAKADTPVVFARWDGMTLLTSQAP